ncbi:DUF6461 domain-containing protein [Streptosporangium sp. NPDC002524]|uniref:DUF6461 domain-containing protein n=1 Tax=Streptosporangium sp. NPDC002524 TaxID=3154537 RepID=UPI00331C061A
MEITSADVAWLARGYELGDQWCLAFARGPDEAEALRRIGADDRSIRLLTCRELIDEGVFPGMILAGRLEDWTVLIEPHGWRASEPGVLRALSAGTEAVMVMRQDHSAHLFEYAVDGELVTSFDPMIPAWRYGSDPDRLVDAMRAVGFDPGYAPGDGDENEEEIFNHPTVDGALLLAFRLTGVVLTQDVLNRLLLGGAVNSRA